MTITWCECTEESNPTRYGRRAHDCAKEARAVRALLKRGKPASYRWRWWHDPHAGEPKPLVLGPKPSAAMEARWKAALTKACGEYSDRQERERVKRIEAYFAARHSAEEGA